MRNCTAHSIKDLRGHVLVLFAGVTKVLYIKLKRDYYYFLHVFSNSEMTYPKMKTIKKNSLKVIPRMLTTCVHNAIFLKKSRKEGREKYK